MLFFGGCSDGCEDPHEGGGAACFARRARAGMQQSRAAGAAVYSNIFKAFIERDREMNSEKIRTGEDRNSGKASFGLVLVLLIAVIIAGAGYKYIHGIGEPLDSSSQEKISVDIPSGSGTAAIGRILEEDGVIKSARQFKIKSRMDKNDGKYRTGVYELSPSMDMNEIMQILMDGSQSTLRFMVPEGYTLKQIADKFAETGNGTAEDFLNETENGDFDFEYNDQMVDGEKRYEGFLYPDTYEIYKNESAHGIIQRMLTRFEQVYDAAADEATVDTSKYSVFDLVTVASLIEREVKLDEERPLVASVIYNRLNKNMKLQMCSTVQYALGTPKARLMNSDLKIDSPYNTYQNAGLPAGPIASPGQASISAALHPADTDYLYFVLTSAGSGKHNFASTGDDFSSYREDYLASLTE